jgi:hypothetical protein
VAWATIDLYPMISPPLAIIMSAPKITMSRAHHGAFPRPFRGGVPPGLTGRSDSVAVLDRYSTNGSCHEAKGERPL